MAGTAAGAKKSFDQIMFSVGSAVGSVRVDEGCLGVGPAVSENDEHPARRSRKSSPALADGVRIELTPPPVSEPRAVSPDAARAHDCA
jgi:hypothetical protein